MIGLMVGLLTLFGGGEYGLSIVGVPAVLGNGCGIQGLIMLHYSRGVKWRQGFTTAIGSYVYNALG